MVVYQSQHLRLNDRHREHAQTKTAPVPVVTPSARQIVQLIKGPTSRIHKNGITRYLPWRTGFVPVVHHTAAEDAEYRF